MLDFTNKRKRDIIEYMRLHPFRERSKKRSKAVLVGVLLVLIICGGTGAWFLYRYVDNSRKATPSPIKNGVNYGPPTEQEIADTEQHKKDLENKSNQESQGPTSSTSNPGQTSKIAANIVLTYTGVSGTAVEGSGYISNVNEDGGTCTLVLTKGPLRAEGISKGIFDVNKTSCPTISIPRNQLGESGEWSAVLTYNSPGASGASSAQIIKVP